MKIICIWLELWKKLRVGRPTSHKVDGGPVAISWKMEEKSKEKMKEMGEKTIGNQIANGLKPKTISESLKKSYLSP